MVVVNIKKLLKLIYIPFFILILASCKSNKKIEDEVEPVTPIIDPTTTEEYIFSSTSLGVAEAVLNDKMNYKITFYYTTKTNEEKEIYFIFNAEGSTKLNDSQNGIMLTNQDPDGLTYMANNRQYMYKSANPDDGFYYMNDEYDSEAVEYHNIWYWSNYFVSEILSQKKWNYIITGTNYYRDEDGLVYYVNNNKLALDDTSIGNELRIRKDVITIIKGSGAPLPIGWLNDSTIQSLDKVVVSDINQVTLTKPNLLAEAEEV